MKNRKTKKKEENIIIKEETKSIQALTDAMSKMAFQLSQISTDNKERKVRFSGEGKSQRKVCIFCDKEDCWKSKCPELKLYIQQGHVALDDSGFIVDSAKIMEEVELKLILNL